MKCFGEDDVIRNRPPRQEQIFLQHVAGQTGAQEHGFALQPNVAAIRLHQPGDEVEEGGFSAAAGPQDGEKLPLLQGKRDILNGGDGGFIGGEVFGEVCDLEIRCRHGVTPFLAGGEMPLPSNGRICGGGKRGRAGERKICGRGSMEKRPSRAAQKGSRDNVPCRVKGRRPLWGLGQRPNCCNVRPVMPNATIPLHER